jgi:hypothetical protein
MKNITEMREQLSTLFSQLKDGSVDVKIAAEMNNTAGKIINSLRVELDYAEQRNEIPSIAFLKDKSLD